MDFKYYKFDKNGKVDDEPFQENEILIHASDAVSMVKEAGKNGFKQGYTDGVRDTVISASSIVIVAMLICNLATKHEDNIKGFFKKILKRKNKNAEYEADFEEDNK